MKLARAILVLSVAPLGALAADSKDSKKPVEKPPFYRKYLVAGDPLDNRIVEQEKRVEAAPDDAELRNDFGNLLAARRFPVQAAEQYEKALRLDKHNFISAYNLGLLYESVGKTGRAIDAYKRSIARKPGFPPSHFRLGRLYERRGDPRDAVEQYAEAMRIDPAMRDPRRNPLVVDSGLIYEASLINYERDLATISVKRDDVFFDEARFRKVPLDRPLSSEDITAAAQPSSEAEPPPRDLGTGDAAGAITSGSGAAARRNPVRPATSGAPAGVGVRK